MVKWIAEFELEDGDTMPEHMDLEYKGAKLDFHCRPLEQEPTTKDDVVALDFSDDIDTPNKYQTAEGKWHEGKIPTTKNDLVVDREDAVERLNALKQLIGYDKDSEIVKATQKSLDMAISALEHPERNVIAVVPCGDTVSRQAVIDLMMQKWGENFSGDDAMQESIDAIRVMPSVTPQEPTDKCKWIKYDHRTMCPKEHIDVDSPYWRIPENRMETLKYCPYCGKEIEVEE